jgi:hypothetical protein
MDERLAWASSGALCNEITVRLCKPTNPTERQKEKEAKRKKESFFFFVITL